MRSTPGDVIAIEPVERATAAAAASKAAAAAPHADSTIVAADDARTAPTGRASSAACRPAVRSTTSRRRWR